LRRAESNLSFKYGKEKGLASNEISASLRLMRYDLINTHYLATRSAKTPVAFRAVLAMACRELTEAEYTGLLAKLCLEIGHRK
jgi:hypothetical protein